MADCQVIGFDCPAADLCTRCGGTGAEPLTEAGSDPCCHCDHCFDEEAGWSTGVEPGTPSVDAVRRLVTAGRNP